MARNPPKAPDIHKRKRPSNERSGELPVRHAPTIRDVARLADVSIGTVSKALNNSGNLRPETRTRIAELARSIGFRPNDLAQSLHRGQSLTVGLISNDNFGRFTMPILEGLESVLHDNGIAVFMCNATDDPDREARHLDQLMSKQVDGLVFTARRADRRSPTTDLGNIPAIHVFSRGHDDDAFCLLPDDEGGAFLAAKHLLETGRKKIAHVTGPESFEAVKLRRDGFLRAAASAGLHVRPECILHGTWSEAWGRVAIEKLFRDPAAAPDGIVAGNDQIARGIVDALRDRGIDVPKAVGVTGFDNWNVMVEAARPPLTSVDMNLVELGKQAGHRMMRMIAGERFSGVERLPCTLVVRESTRKSAAANK